MNSTPAILALVLNVACIIPFIIVLIKLFKEKGALHGILGIICAIYTFIWGWMNAGRLGLKNIMIIWSLLIVAGMVLNGMAAKSIPGAELPNTELPASE
jgi:hypothetical protein